MEIKKILVPIDSIEYDNTLNAVRSAMEFSEGCTVEKKEPELVFMHVFDIKPRVPMSERRRLIEMKRKKIKEEFKTIREMCKERKLKRVRTLLKEGNPEETIVETAQEENTDLIVMGSGKLHDRSASGRIHKFFYGSVTEKVIHEAPCSILVARP